MKERPILFSAPMVRAIIAGTKSQTRRVAPIADLNIKANSNDLVTWGVSFTKPIKGSLGSYSGGKFTEDQARRIIASQFCPYGQPGDRLWVREAFSGPYCMEATEDLAGVPPSKWGELASIWYWADGDPLEGDWTKPRPSIHMPRWASRITLEITGVRVERLQEVSVQDAIAEGCASGERDPVVDYLHLWESINGPGSWDANPWVWVIEFRQVNPITLVEPN